MQLKREALLSAFVLPLQAFPSYLFKIIYYFMGKGVCFFLFFFIFLVHLYGKLSYFCRQIEIAVVRSKHF